MDDKGKLTAWTALLTVAGIILAVVGGFMAPDSTATWLLVGAWMCANTALNNVYGKVRTAVRESEIRRQERERLGAPPQDGRY
jgi:fatty acid desaturase